MTRIVCALSKSAMKNVDMDVKKSMEGLVITEMQPEVIECLVIAVK